MRGNVVKNDIADLNNVKAALKVLQAKVGEGSTAIQKINESEINDITKAGLYKVVYQGDVLLAPGSRRNYYLLHTNSTYLNIGSLNAYQYMFTGSGEIKLRTRHLDEVGTTEGWSKWENFATESGVDGQIAEVGVRVVSLEQKGYAVDAQLAEAAARISENTNSISEVGTRVTTLESDVGDIEGQFAEATASISANKGAIEEILGSIANLDSTAIQEIAETEIDDINTVGLYRVIPPSGYIGGDKYILLQTRYFSPFGDWKDVQFKFDTAGKLSVRSRSFSSTGEYNVDWSEWEYFVTQSSVDGQIAEVGVRVVSLEMKSYATDERVAEEAARITTNTNSISELDTRLFTLESEVGDIEAALDNIIAIQETLIGGDSV